MKREVARLGVAWSVMGVIGVVGLLLLEVHDTSAWMWMALRSLAWGGVLVWVGRHLADTKRLLREYEQRLSAVENMAQGALVVFEAEKTVDEALRQEVRGMLQSEA